MIKRFNQYLLTNYPLLWNTRIVWMLLINGLLHGLFFIGGYFAIRAAAISQHHSVWSVGGSGLYTLSVLCSLLVLILWLVYLLRNNAFKSYYRVGKWHLAKEFLLLLIIIFTSIIYFESFNLGVRSKVRSITPLSLFEQEVNAVNLALGFIPTAKGSYFFLNSCAENNKHLAAAYNNEGYPYELSRSYTDTASPIVREALQRPDAFSYKNYCELEITYGYAGIDSAEQLTARRQTWMDGQRRDSITAAIKVFTAICDKYGIDQKLNVPLLVNNVFAKPAFAISSLTPTSQTDYNSGEQRFNTYYIEEYSLSRAFGLLYESLPNRESFAERRTGLTIEAYFALSFATLLLCYRRFSRRIFLISFLGTIVWVILVSLIGIGVSGNTTFITVLPIVLCVLFLLVGLSFVRTGSFKPASGALLNWHAYLAPFVIPFLIMLISSYYNGQYRNGMLDIEMERRYPFSAWVTHHKEGIFIANLFLAIAYITFVFNAIAKRHSTMPEE